MTTRRMRPPRDRRRRRRVRRDLRAVRRGHVDLVRARAPDGRRDGGRIAKTTSARRGWWSRSTASSAATPTGPGIATARRTTGRSRRPCTSTATSRGRGHRAGGDAALLDVLRLQGFHLVVAGITQPNPASTALHRALGFGRIGEFGAIGWKKGAGTAWSGTALELGPRDLRRRRSARWRTRSPTGQRARAYGDGRDPRASAASACGNQRHAGGSRWRQNPQAVISQALDRRARAGPSARPYSSRVDAGSRPIEGTSSQS